MKRSLVAALVIGLLVGALVIAMHATHLLRPLEEALMNALAAGRETTRVVGSAMQYALVVILSLGTAWMMLASSRRRPRLALVLGLLALELLALSWVCALYRISFQPLPSLAAIVLAFLGAAAGAAFLERSRSGLARNYFRGRVSAEQQTRLASGEISFDPEARSYEMTAVVCDIANKHDLAEECSPALLSEITEKFIRHATDSFLKAGAYIETVTGEGIVALFGFPENDEAQAEKAIRHSLALLRSFGELRVGGKDGERRDLRIHLGIASGTAIIAPLEKDDRSELLATGEPVELARRFCIANRFYGSSVLIGPGAFEMASKAIVARPIDFLSGVDIRERHEIYEPLMLASEATPEQLARRDAFWNGVVLYREKRWAEAYSQFQKARGPDAEDDAPLQLYLRRLEPLALHLVDSPD